MSARCRRPHGPRVLAVVALLAALVAAGCGGSGTSSASDAGPDPATVAPASAAIYGQVVVRPTGAANDGVLAAARKVLNVQEPAVRLRELLDSDTSGGVRFSRDVEPWLGDRVGAFMLMPAGGLDVTPSRSSDAPGPDWGAIVAIRDGAAFADALPHLRHGQHRAGSYRGVAYDRDGGDATTYGARIGDFYVLGSLAGLRAAIDASKGPSLADASRFTDAIARVPAGALASVYADPRALASALGGARSATPTGRRLLASFAASGPIVAGLTANAHEIAIEGSGDSTLAGDFSGSSEGEVTVGQMPGDAWLALATPPLGPAIKDALERGGVHDEAAAQVRARLGLDLDRDLLDPLGGLGVFVRGGSPLDLGGGALLQMTDAAAARRLLTRLEALVSSGAHLPTQSVSPPGAQGFQVQVPRSPQPIVVLAKGDRVAAGYAASSAQDLLAPPQRFDDGSAGKAAVATLGDGYTPSFVLIVPPLAGLLRSLDELQVADLSSVLPYVRAYRSLAIGTKRDGDRTTVRIVTALR
jgi:Protein of unknown function (DUF3352)